MSLLIVVVFMTVGTTSPVKLTNLKGPIIPVLSFVVVAFLIEHKVYEKKCPHQAGFKLDVELLAEFYIKVVCIGKDPFHSKSSRDLSDLLSL